MSKVREKLSQTKIVRKKESKKEQEITYVKRFLQHDPTGLRLYLKVFQVVRTVRSAQRVHNGTVVVRVLVGSGNAQNVRPYACILFDIFHVFLKRSHLR